MTPTSKSILQLHFTTFLWSVTPLFAKLIPLPAYAIICIRSLITAMTLALFVWVFKGSLRVSTKKGIGFMALLGIIMCVHWVTLFHGIQTSTVSIAIISFYTFPVMSGMIEPFFFKEKWDARELFSSFLILLGIYFIVPEFSLTNQSTVGILWVILSAFLFAIRNIIIRKYGNEYKSSVIMFYQMIITGLLLLPFVATQIPSVDFPSWWKLVLMSVVFTAIPHTLLAKSLKTVKASTAGIIVSLQPLYSTLFAIWLLGEIPSPYVWVGGTLVGGAVILESLRKKT
jgi:drug/metabolite transporter (DMT)-like permease